MTRCSATVCKAMTLALLAGTAAAAMAQPTTFIDIGPVTAAATPASVREYVQLPFELFDQGFDGQGEVLTIKWIRFTLPRAIEGDLYLDIDSRIYTVDGEPGEAKLRGRPASLRPMWVTKRCALIPPSNELCTRLEERG